MIIKDKLLYLYLHVYIYIYVKRKCVPWLPSMNIKDKLLYLYLHVYIYVKRRCVPWLPSMIIKDKLYLGRVEQAEDPNIIRNLGKETDLSSNIFAT